MGIGRGRSHLVKELFTGLGEYSKRADWFNFVCPYHHGHSKNFGVSLRRSWFHCFSCGESGSIFRLVKDLRDGKAYGEGNGTFDLSEWEIDEQETAPEAGTIDHDKNTEWFYSRYKHITDCQGTVESSKARLYLRNRGIDYNHTDVGLLDEMEGRVVFPFVESGRVVYYVGRCFYPMTLKTLNPPKVGWLGKNEVLYGCDSFFGSDSLIITEGLFDSIYTEAMTGIKTTCLLGKTLSPRQEAAISRYGFDTVYVLLDADAQDVAWSLGDQLYKAGINVRVCVWGKEFPRSADPNTIEPDALRGLIRAAVPVGWSTGLLSALGGAS